MWIAGLEAALAGKSEGDAFDVEVAPADGYGERQDEAVQNVPRDAFPPEAELEAGLQFQATGPDGQPLMGTISSIEGEVVTVDFNHPLAGETLLFSIEVVSRRVLLGVNKEPWQAF